LVRQVSSLSPENQAVGGGGRKAILTKAKIRLAQAAMGKRETILSHLCKELGIARATLYRYVGPDGKLREFGKRVLRG